MKNKIAIVTTGHPPYDERIYWKFAKSLSKNGFDVRIVSTTGEMIQEEDTISIIGIKGSQLNKSGKIKWIAKALSEFQPGIIICCEPLPVIAALRYKRTNQTTCKIILDVTEWYPENVAAKFKGVKRYVTYITLLLLNIYASNKADILIIGEVSKQKRYNIFSPFTKKIIIGYYPVLKFFKYSPPPFNGTILTLCYAGLINFERGILSLLNVASLTANRHPSITVKLKVIGKFQLDKEEKLFYERLKHYNNFLFEKVGWTDYTSISSKLEDVDICFDLRTRTFIYRNSLPIKIFEYMASGKPFIFSDIKPIRKEMDTDSIGFLVDPDNFEDIILKIENYIYDKTLLLQHSKNGRHLIEKGRNWESESQKLLDLVREQI